MVRKYWYRLPRQYKNKFYFFDTAGGVFNQISKSLQYGAMHSIPITLSLPPIGCYKFRHQYPTAKIGFSKN